MSSHLSSATETLKPADKDFFRKQVFSHRKKLLPRIRTIKSNRIEKLLNTLEIFTEAKTILVYAPLPGEVDIEPLIQQLLSQGKQVVLPYMKGDSSDGMEGHIIKNFPEDLEPHPGYIFLQPIPDICPKIEPENLDCILLPGVAFDPDGKRVGFGKGCYDRYLKKVPQDIPRIGLAFEFQIFHQVPAEDFDQKATMIVSEDQVLFPSTQMQNINSPDEMIQLGKKWGEKLMGNEVIAFQGDLGAGKTTLIQGILSGFGVSEVVTSPTFIQVNSYEGNSKAHHLDLYRWKAGGSDEEKKMLLEELLDTKSLVLIEWADRVSNLLPKNSIKVTLSVTGLTKRSLQVTTYTLPED